MLDNMRRSGASIFIYLIFGILIAIFVVNINPGSTGQGGGCTPQSNAIVKVDDTNVHTNDFHIALDNPFNSVQLARRFGLKRKEYYAVEMLIRRELLAQAGAERGIRVGTTAAEEELKKGHFYFGGRLITDAAYQILDIQLSQVCEPIDGKPVPDTCKKTCSLDPQYAQFADLMCGPGYHCVSDPDNRGQGRCDAKCTPGGDQCYVDPSNPAKSEMCTTDGYCAFAPKNRKDAWISHLRVTEKSYLSEQAREMEAKLMQDLLASSVRVSREEVKSIFIHTKTTAAYDTVAFAPLEYRKAMQLTDADIKRFLDTHKTEVKAKYDADYVTKYKSVNPELKLREIFVAKTARKDEPKPDPGAGSGSGSVDEAAKKAEEDKKQAADKKALDEAVARLEAARAKIAAVDATGRAKKFAELAGGELNSDEALRNEGGLVGWKSKASPQLGDKRLSDEVKELKPGEMTKVIAIPEKGAYLIFVEAMRPLGDSKELKLADVELEIAADLAKETWSKEQAKRDALAALERALESNKKLSELYPKDATPPGGIQIDPEKMKLAPSEIQGANRVRTIDIPVAWKAEGDGGGGAPAGSADAGSATGAGAGSGAPPTPAPAPTPAPDVVPDSLKPTNETMPHFGTVPAPKVESHPATPRAPRLPGVDKDGVKALFEVLAPGQISPRIYEVDGSYVLLQLTAKGEPKMDEFDKDADRMMQGLRAQRAMMLVEDWLKVQCEALLKADKINLRVQFDEKDNYVPCTSFGRLGGGMMPDFEDE